MNTFGLALYAIFIIFAVNVQGHGRGYSLSFQGVKPIAGIRKGEIDWDDPGWKDLDANFTVSLWAKCTHGVMGANMLSFSGPRALLLSFNYFGVIQSSAFAQWEKDVHDPAFAIHHRHDWHYYTISMSSGVLRVYLNGSLNHVLPLAQWGVEVSFRQNGTRLVLGDSMTGDISLPIYSDALRPNPTVTNPGFHGKLDDLSIWSRALSASEIEHYMKVPVNVSEIPNDLVAYYNFDVRGCSRKFVSSLHQDSMCDIVATGTVHNYGVSGSKYDLLLGQLNDDASSGNTWFGERNILYKTEYPFEKPSPSDETPPNYPENNHSDPSTPSVMVVAPGTSTLITLPARLSPKMLRNKPFVGYVAEGDSPTNPIQNFDNLSATAILWYIAPENMTQAFLFTIHVEDSAGVIYSHDIHVWAFTTPLLATEGPKLRHGTYTVGIPPKSMVLLELMTLGISLTGEDLDIRILGVSKSMLLEQLIPEEKVLNGRRYLDVQKIPITSDQYYMHHRSGNVLLIHDNSSSLETYSMSLEFVSSKTNRTSKPLNIEFNVIKTDRLPVVTAKTAVAVDEDDATGVDIVLEGDDFEKNRGFYIAITKLPKQGSLYHADSGRLIDRSFQLFDNGAPLTQYVNRIRKVSSFWPHKSSEDFLSNHPLHVVGPPGCRGPHRNSMVMTGCQYSDLLHTDSSIPLQSVVLVNIYHANSPLANVSMTPLRLPGRVVETSTSGQKRTFSVELLKMYKRVGGNVTQCVLDRGPGNSDVVYPQDCDHKLGIPDPFIIPNVTIDELSDSWPRGWSPSHVARTQLENVEAAYMFGEEFAFDVEVNVSSSRDTEIIQVEFATPVYPIFVEIGFPFGGGGLVNLKALSPIGEWVSLYNSAPQLEKAQVSLDNNKYYFFTESICRQNFRVSTLELEFDTSIRSGIPKFLLDYISLTGSLTIQPAILGFGLDNVKYIPHGNAFGQDSFEFRASDCGGAPMRSSNVGNVTIDIRAQWDAPIFEPNDKIRLVDTFAKCFDNGTGTAVKITVAAKDVDGGDIHFKIASSIQTQYGNIVDGFQVNSSSLLQLTRSKLVQGTRYSTADFVYQVGVDTCQSHNFFVGLDTINVSVIDGTGAMAQQTLQVKILKHNRHLPSQAKGVAYGFFLVNLLLCLCALVYIYEYWRHPIIQFSQPGFLLLIVLGAFISSSTILAIAQDDGESATLLNTANIACLLMPWLYTLGFVTTYASIYLKMYRVGRYFDKKLDLQSHSKLSISRLLSSISYWWLIDIVLCVVWTLDSPLQFTRQVLGKEGDFVTESYGFCHGGDHDAYYVAAISIYHVLILLTVLYYCFKTVGLNESLSEAKYIRFSVFSSLQLLLFSLPVLMITSDNPNTIVSIRSGFIWVNDATVLCLIFLPKIKFHLVGLSEEGEGYKTMVAAMERTSSNKVRPVDTPSLPISTIPSSIPTVLDNDCKAATDN